MTWPTALVLVAILAFLALAFHSALKAIHDAGNAARRGNMLVMIASFIAILLVILLHDHAFAATLDLLRHLLTSGPGTH